MNAKQIGRNDLCTCGSGQKYKRCCAGKDAAARSAELLAEAAARTATLEAAALAEAEASEGSEEQPAKKEVAKPKRPKLPKSYGSQR